MELNNFRPESHVAQRSRRDKLRVQQSSIAQPQHLGDYPSNYEQLSYHQELNPDFVQVSNVRYGNISYNPGLISSEMLNFSSNSQVVNQESPTNQPISPMFNGGSKVSTGHDPQNCGTWKSIWSQPSCDWVVNYPGGGLTGVETNQNSPFVGEGDVKVNSSNISSSCLYLKPNNFNVYQEVSSQNRQKHYEEVHFNSPPFYPNGPILPHYGDQSNPWISGDSGFVPNKSNRDLRSVVSDSNTQGLSLSLSPVFPTKPHNNDCREDLNSRIGVVNEPHGSKNVRYDYPCSNSSKPPVGGAAGVVGNTSDMVGSSTFTHRNVGPLGPFTGYATILKGSKFLKPAQLLLDEICGVNGPRPVETCEVLSKVSNESKGLADVVNLDESLVGAKGGDSGVSSTNFYGSNEISGEAGVRSSSVEYFRPEYQQKKAKLLYMQEEVCRRYKQYHQQMQMVVSSFETVAGLSSATPYVSLALKTVTRHFRCLKNAITDQIKNVRKVLGEDLSSPTTGASSSKGDTRTSGFKFINDHSFMNPKSGGGGLGFFEAQQPVWRPQRGLPERSVAILRSWLFDHFLHPYPTDTDKHMLASRTGLSRNQVSNWFINARVRLWKPMVEEIHMLETKGSAESNIGQKDGQCTVGGGTSRPQPTNRPNAEQWNRDKRTRVECQVPASMDGSLMGFVPYQRNGLEIGGLGPVSLTLGLRQSAESGQQQQEHHQLRQQHFGGQMIHDFVG